MKRVRRIVFSLVLSIVPLVLFAQGSNPAFDEVSAKLDKGGTYFMYMQVRDWSENLIRKFEPVFQHLDPDARQVPGIARAVVKALGIDNLDDIGISCVAHGENLVRTKVYLSLREPAGLFGLIGDKPRELDTATYIPADAVVAASTVFCFDRVFPIVESVVKGVAGAVGETALKNHLEEAKKEAGADIRALADSLGDEIAFFIRLDDANKVDLPAGGEGAMQVPRPGFVLMIATKDSKVYDFLRSKLEEEKKPVKEVTIGEVKGVESTKEDNPLGIKPVLAHGQNKLFLASSAGELEAAVAAHDGKKDFRSSESFQKLAKDIPAQVNGVAYVSPRVVAEVSKILKRVEQSGDKDARTAVALAGSVLGLSDDGQGMVAVRVSDDKGVLWVKTADRFWNQVFSMSAPGVAIAAAIAIPNFLKARERAQGRLCEENVAKLDGAKEQWALENKKENGATVEMKDLVGTYLKREPVCPQGGTYTLNPIGKNPTCSVHGGTLGE